MENRADWGSWLCSHSATHSFSHAAVLFIEFENGLCGGHAFTHTALYVLGLFDWQTSLKRAIKHLQSATRSGNQDVKVNTICLCWHTQCADTWFYLLLRNTALSVTTLIGLERGRVLGIICVTGLVHHNKLGCLIFPVLRLTFSVSAAPPPTGSQHAQSHKIRNCFPLSTRKRLNEE